MSAEIFILPIVKVEREENCEGIVIALSRRDHGRLKRRAAEWGVSESWAASMMLSQALDPRGRK